MQRASQGSAEAEVARTDPFIRVFGGVSVDDVDGPVSIGGPRQRRLLALLALRAGTVVDIDWLAEYLWDDDDRPEATAPSLRTYVSRLRSAFPEAARQWIVTESEGYRLAAPPDAVEHLRFTRLRAEATAARERGDPQSAERLLKQALELWRGEPFRELAELEPAESEIERLRLDRLDMMEERWEAALALGRHTQITGELAAFASEHAERDRAVRQYALALHRSGQTTEALRVVREHRRVLVDEFGLDPSAEIDQLERALLDDDPSLMVEAEGRPLRGYELLEEIGMGSFALVWRGMQPSVGREVAVKQIRSELATQPAFIRRFEAEAHLVARIEHPHIVPLIDYWRDPDSAYLVMRWLRGGTLERRLDDGPLTLEETVAIARQIGGALAAAHAHGVIHRDVKTANILFDEAGHAFLTDFGIALEAAETSGPEAALSPGTPAYSSPEQIRQEPLGPASDVFSLGVVLYECLAGALPFAQVGAVDELLEKQLHEPYPALSELRNDVPVRLADVIARATAKDAAERYAAVEAFVGALETALAPATGEAAPAHEPIGEIDNPYVGLFAFDDASADRFFGRERLVAELVARLSGSGVNSRCVVIVGPSGSGKSSVAWAGLLPALRDGAVPGSSDWFVTTMAPGDDPYESLEAALLRVAVNPPSTLLDQLRDGRRGILRGVRRCLPSDEQRLVLLMDQLEELFVGRSSEDADEFLDALAVAVTEPSSPLRLAATLRADYYGRPLEHHSFAAVLDAATVNVTPLAGDELERAIVEPARALGVTYEPGLVARIAAETAGQPSPLPLLQYTLAELFERRDGRTLTAAAYDDIGGLSGALAARAEALYRDGDTEARAATRRVFGRLIDPAEETADLRRRARVADLGSDDATRWVLERFGEARLITFDHDVASREPTVEVAHEALLREWPRLVGWLRADRELLRAVGTLADAAARWEAEDKADEDLLRGARLERATELVATERSHLRPVDVEFVAASSMAAQAEREAEERGQRRLRLLAGAVGAALVVALAAGSIALLQLVRADEEAQAATAAQEQAELEALFRTASEADPATGILLSLEAQRRDPGTETDMALLSALARASGGRTVAAFEAIEADDCSSIWPGWVSRDGMTLTAAAEGQAVTRDLGTGEVSAHFDMPGDGCGSWYGDAAADRRYAVSEAPSRIWLGPFEGPWEHEVKLDGRSWVSGADGLAGERLLLETRGGVSLVDATAGTRVGPPIFGLDEDPVVALDDDGSRVAVATPRDSGKDRAGTVVVLDAADATELARVPIDADLRSLHFDRGRSQLLLAGTADGRVLELDVAEAAVTSEEQVAEEAIVDIDSGEDAGVIVVGESEPPAIHMLDGTGGSEPMAVAGLYDAVLRPDGSIASWDGSRRVEVVEPAGEVLEAASIDLGDLSITVDDWVALHDGRAVVISERTPDSVAIDLRTGERETLSLLTADGSRFPVMSGPMIFADGHVAISNQGEIGLWRDGQLVDRLDLRDSPADQFDGADNRGARVIVGVRSGDDDLRVSLLDVEGEHIDRLMTVEPQFWIFRAHPLDDDRLLLLDVEGVAHVYGRDGELLDEYGLGFDPTVGFLALAFDGQGRTAVARESTVRGSSQIDIIDPVAGETHAFLSLGQVANLALARDGRLLLIQGADGSIRLHDLQTGVTSPVVWDGSVAPLGRPWYDEATDSAWMATTDRLVQLPLDRDGWREQACRRVGRELSEDEWSRLVPGDGPRVNACAGVA